MPTAPTTFTPGSLVSARGRDWVVLPSEPDESDVLLLRPVDGTIQERAGLFWPLDGSAVQSATYQAPDPAKAGDFDGAQLLFDAARLNLHAGAGPFRSLGWLSVTPRPYQYVPLLMALRLDPVRLLIADDVGVGKTIEAALIARELLDRGIISRIGVLCPPHLCEQWAKELRDKFQLDPAVIQPARMARLERELPRPDISVFKHHRHLVASIDFVKSERYKDAFVRNAPEFLIVDEAHTATRPKGRGGSQQQRRYALVRELAQDSTRHLLLTTATPHSGIEESFRSLLGLIDERFDQEDPEATIPKKQLNPHVIQRRRADLEHWMGTDTPFPTRESIEHKYALAPEYTKLFDDVLAYCRESVAAPELRQNQRRVRYWAAIAILRCLLSSPAAAEAMLERRAAKKRDKSDAAEPTDDEQYRRQILDTTDSDEAYDYNPRAPLDDPEAALTESELRRLDGFLKRSKQLRGEAQDTKLAAVADVVSGLLEQGHRPIVYCRYIDTARYVAARLQRLLAAAHASVHVVAITGDDGTHQQREKQIEELAKEPRRVLVATDCLSEGINLQEWFDAVVHYDLPWNPNRLEQREGRVDRYGQTKDTVRTVLLYGSNNQMDLTVLRVLIEKARRIREQLGVAVPVPDSDEVIEAVIEGLLLKGQDAGQQLELALDTPAVSAFHKDLLRSAEREQERQAAFAQTNIHPDSVQRELEEIDPVLGAAADVHRFVGNALQRVNGSLEPGKRDAVFRLRPGDLDVQMKRALGEHSLADHVQFDDVPREDVVVLGRNHPVVNTLADWALGRALVGDDAHLARSSAIFTDAVASRTVVLLLRLRYLLREAGKDLFAEEIVAPAFERRDGAIAWLEPPDRGVELITTASPTANMPAAERRDHIAWALQTLAAEWYAPIVDARAAKLTASHERLRQTLKSKSRLRVNPHTPPDILGCYVLVPAGAG